MIYIEKNNLNKVAIEAIQGIPANQIYWLFEMINETAINEKSIFYTTPDISSSPNRYNLFVINESDLGSTASLVNNVPICLDAGQWRVNLYSNINPWNLNIPFTTGPSVQTIRMIVSGTNSIVNPVYNGAQFPSPIDDVYK
jgi:hypothetical protein